MKKHREPRKHPMAQPRSKRRRKAAAPKKPPARVDDPDRPKPGDADYVPTLNDMLDGTAPPGGIGDVEMGGDFTGR